MVLLTHGYFLMDDEKERSIMKPYVPLGMLYVSAFLSENGVNHEVFDSTFSTFAEQCEFILRTRPSIIGIYTNLMTKLNVLRLIDFIRADRSLKTCRIVLGGPELRHNALNYLNSGADLLVIGEGEQTFYEVCKHYENSDRNPEHIQGLAFKGQEGEVVFTAERALFRDLDLLPAPAREKVDLKKYAEVWKIHHGAATFSISTMRGCPYTCKWCSRAVYGGTYRRRSPAAVAAEIQSLINNYAPDRLWFVDDVFTISHKWLRGFKEELQKRKISIPYEIITRADRMNEEVIGILKETGCFRVWIGAESGSQEIIDAMDRRVNVKKVGEMIISTRKAGIEAGTFIMLGYPGEKRKHIRETIQHLKEARPNSYTITVAYPISGTPLFSEVSESLQAKDVWRHITDRDYRFRRSHSERFYRFALSWVYNEVEYDRSTQVLQKIKLKGKSLAAQALMLIS